MVAKNSGRCILEMVLAETVSETVAATIRCIEQTHAIGTSNSQPNGESPSWHASSRSLVQPYWDQWTVGELVAITDGSGTSFVTTRQTIVSIDSK